jgi:hypothetical protein
MAIDRNHLGLLRLNESSNEAHGRNGCQELNAVLHDDAPMLIGDGGLIFDFKPIPTQGSHSHRTAERPVNAKRAHLARLKVPRTGNSNCHRPAN